MIRPRFGRPSALRPRKTDSLHGSSGTSPDRRSHLARAPDVAAPWGECRSEGAVPAPIGAPAARTRDCTSRGPTPASRERVLLSALLLAAIGSQLAVLSTLLRSMSSARRVRMGRPGSMIEEVFVATADRSRPGPLSPGTDQSTVMTMSSRASFRDEPHRRTNAHPARPGRRLPTFIDSKQPGPLPPASEQRSREAPTSERHASARSIVRLPSSLP